MKFVTNVPGVETSIAKLLAVNCHHWFQSYTRLNMRYSGQFCNIGVRSKSKFSFAIKGITNFSILYPLWLALESTNWQKLPFLCFVGSADLP